MKSRDGQDYEYENGYTFDVIGELKEESKRLDWFEKNNHLILNLGTSWYVRSAYGQPWMKKKTLREAIDVGMAFVSE